MNVLISAAGRRVSLVKFFKKELLRIFKEEGKVFTTDLNPELSSACQLSDKSFKVGSFRDENYIDHLLTICEENGVNIIIPTLDTELLLLARNRDEFEKIGVLIILSDEAIIAKCRNKHLTRELFSSFGIESPTSIDPNNPQFPLFVKPVDGSSSSDLHLIKNEEDFFEPLKNVKKYVHQAYMDPKTYDEYTVDMYYDKGGFLKCLVPRLRITTRSGEINKGLTLDNEVVPFLKERMMHVDGFRGCITLQLFLSKEDKSIFGIEINPRFGGGYPLSYLAGANYIDYIIREYVLFDTIEFYDQWESNLLLLRHDEEMIVSDYNGKYSK